MNLRSCPHEPELQQAIESGHWPQACPQELHEHVRRCSHCQTTAALLAAFRFEREMASASASLEPHGAIWWRAQLRRRKANLETLERPLFAARIFAALVCLLAAVLFLRSPALIGSDWFQWERLWPSNVVSALTASFETQSPFVWVLAIAVAVLLAASFSAALYMAAKALLERSRMHRLAKTESRRAA